MILITPPILLELLRQALGHRWPGRLFVFLANDPLMTALTVLETTLCVAIPIKIWNSARIEHKLQEQEKLLMTARIEALASQINPHFLFNTLHVDLVADPLAARDGADADRQAVGAAAAAAARARITS